MTKYTEGQRVRIYAPHRRGEGTVLYVSVSGKVRVQEDAGGKSRLYKPEHLRPLEPAAPSVTRAQPVTRTVTYEAPETRAVPREGAVRSPTYLAWLRTLDCAWCGVAGPSEASHHPEPGHGRMAKKTDDLRALPLCTICHGRYHAIGQVGLMSPEQSRQWVETRITRTLIRYMRDELQIGRVA